MRRSRFKINSVYGLSDVSIGPTANSTSASSYPRIIQKVITTKLVYLRSIAWDISTNATVDLVIVNELSSTPTILDTLVAGESVVGSTTHTFNFPTRILKPGIHFFSLVFKSGDSTIRLNTADAFTVSYNDFYWGEIWTTSLGTANVAAFRLIGALCSDFDIYFH